MKEDLVVGGTYEVEYPFIRVEFSTDYGEDTGACTTIDSWAPGCHPQEKVDGYYGGGDVREANALGKMLLTVISIHKPGKYPERVFYLRKWRSPDGNVFGKPSLKITTAANFRKMLKGYRHPFEVQG